VENSEYALMRYHEDTYWWYRGMRELAATAIRRYAGGRNLSLLDAGCGTGGQLAHLSGEDRIVRATGLDFSKDAVGMAAERGLAGLLRGSTMTLPFPDETFDVVTSIDVLYIEGVDDEVAMSEIHRVSKVGGLIVLNLPAFEMLRGRHDAAVHTRRRYRKSEVRGLLREHGFEVLKLSYWNTTLFPVMMVKRTMERLFRAASPPESDMSDLPEVVNHALTALMRLENRIFFLTGMPFGGSIFAVGRRR
jgi:ubiquinone/menaquinone biosynthesis C-methylase UbiE